MLVVDNDELTNIRCIEGDIVIFTEDGINYECPVEYGINTKTEEKETMLSFARFKDNLYLVGINGVFYANKKNMYKTRMKEPVEMCLFDFTNFLEKRS